MKQQKNPMKYSKVSLKGIITFNKSTLILNMNFCKKSRFFYRYRIFVVSKIDIIIVNSKPF